MKVKRGGKWYKVLERHGNEVKVASWFRYAQFPRWRRVKMWWNIDKCDEVKQ